MLPDAIGQFLATRGRQQLAILDSGPEPGAPGVCGQYYGTCHNGTGERAASGLVEAGNAGEASAPQFSLFIERGIVLLQFLNFFTQLR